MAVLVRADDILVEFLRACLTDSRGRHDSDSDSFTASVSQTDFVLTPTTSGNLVQCIVSVTKDGTALNKWQDYEIDLKSKKVILKTACTGSEAVVVAYKASAKGEEWIYPGFAIDSLGAVKFPRIFVWQVDKQGQRMGYYSTDMLQFLLMQVDVQVKEGYSKTYGDKDYFKQDLADYLGLLVEGAFISHVNDLYPLLWDVKQSRGSPSFDEDVSSYKYLMEFTMNGLNVGQ